MVKTPMGFSNETFTQALLENSPDALIGLSPEGKILNWNLGAQQIFGYGADEAVGKYLENLIIPAEKLEESRRAFAEIMETGFTVFETERRRKDGKMVDVDVSMRAVRDKDGGLQFIAVNKKDVSRLKRMMALKQELQLAGQFKSEFLAKMSHELRTPLNAIMGFASLIYKEKVGPLAPKQKEYMGDILTSAGHLLQVINDVLDLAKVEAGKMEFFPEFFDVESLVIKVKDMLREMSGEKGLQVVVESRGDIPLVYLDPSKLQQVLYNFLSNAIKFTPQGGNVSVGLSHFSEAGIPELRIDVTDTGIGIEPADLNKLFVAFQQLSPGKGKKYHGTGLGLFITKRIVEAQGGRVQVQSIPEKGSTFSATFPLHPVKPAAPAKRMV